MLKKIASIFLMFPLMVFDASVFAQQQVHAVSCTLAADLPPLPGHAVSLGVAGPVTGAIDQVMLVGGGANFPDSMPWQGGKKKYYNNVYLFTKKGNKILPKEDSFHLPENISYPANCSTPKGIFYAGGENEQGISNKAYLLHWNEKTNTLSAETLPALPIPLSNAAATTINCTVYLAGGENAEGVSNKVWSLNLNGNDTVWKELPALPNQVSHGVLAAMEVKGEVQLYLLGGRKRTSAGISELYNTVYHYNTYMKEWKALAPLPYALSAGTGVAVADAGVVLFGGDRGTTFSKVEAYIAAISKESNAAKKEELILQKNQLQSSHPGFSKDILFYNVHSQTCTTVGTLAYPTPVTTTAFWWNNIVVIPSGEIKAGVRSPQILMAKISSQ